MNWVDFGFSVGDKALDFVTEHYFHDIQQRDIKNAEKRANAEWDRRFAQENEYNTPTMQALRLKDAGVNPLGVLSGSAPTPSASGSTNQPQAPDKMSMPERIGLAELNLQRKRVENETLVAEAQANNLNSETNLNEEKLLGEQLLNRVRDVEARLSEATFENKKLLSDLDVEEAYAVINEIDRRAEMYASTTGLNEATRQFFEWQKLEILDKLMTNSVLRNLYESNIEVNEAQIERWQEQSNIEWFRAEWDAYKSWEDIRVAWADHFLKEDAFDLSVEEFEWKKKMDELDRNMTEEHHNENWWKDVGSDVAYDLIWLASLGATKGKTANMRPVIKGFLTSKATKQGMTIAKNKRINLNARPVNKPKIGGYQPNINGGRSAWR